MTRRVLLTVAVLALLARGPAAFACSCVAAPVNAEYKEATLVFVGTAMTVRSSEGAVVSVDFAVTDLYKGTSADHITLSTPSSGAACGISFLPGQRYTIFARGAPGKTPSTQLCDGTTDDVRLLSKAGYVHPAQRFSADGTTATAAHPSGGRTLAIVVAGLLVAGVAGTIWAGKRRRVARLEG